MLRAMLSRLWETAMCVSSAFLSSSGGVLGTSSAGVGGDGTVCRSVGGASTAGSSACVASDSRHIVIATMAASRAVETKQIKGDGDFQVLRSLTCVLRSVVCASCNDCTLCGATI